jgi:hypothetical protein
MILARSYSLSALATAVPRAFAALPGIVLEVVVMSEVLFRDVDSLACNILTSFWRDESDDERVLTSLVNRWLSACSVAFFSRSDLLSVVRDFCAASSFLREAIISSWSIRTVST